MIEQLKGFSACDRGNVLLSGVDGDVFNAYLRLPGGGFLEITYRPENYPKVNVAALDITEEYLARHINKRCRGMFADKANVEGLDLNEAGFIRDSEADDDSAEA